ncbi:MAG: DUF2164 domain-containing protein [Clostridiaceae bacterium]
MKKKLININKEENDYMIQSIKKFFQNEREEEIGDLAASLVLDFIMEEIGPKIYNQGVYDSYQYMNDRVEDLLSIQKYK